MPLSLSQATSELKISKSKLYALLKQESVTPTNKGNRKLLSDDDIQKMKDALIAEGRVRFSSSDNSRASVEDLKNNSRETDSSSDQSLMKSLLEEKDRQISRLEELLDKANAKNDRLFEGVIGLQRQMDSLNQRLLLQSPDSKQESQSEPINLKRTFEDAEEAVLAEEKVDPVIAQKPSRNFATTLLWILLGLLGLATVANFTGFQLAEELGEKLNRIVVSN